MTDEKRIKIAESRGWKWYRIPHSERDSRGPLRALFLPAIHEIDQSPIWLVPGEPTDRIANMEYMERDGHLRDYFHDCAAAVALCEAMRAEGWSCVIRNDYSTEKPWRCKMEKAGALFTAEANTFPAAVAECYGKSKELWK